MQSVWRSYSACLHGDSSLDSIKMSENKYQSLSSKKLKKENDNHYKQETMFRM